MFSVQCCVFPAAVVLLDSWYVLLGNLWEEHLNHSLIVDLKLALEKIIRKNENTEVMIQLKTILGLTGTRVRVIWFVIACINVFILVSNMQHIYRNTWTRVALLDIFFMCMCQNCPRFLALQRFQEETDLAHFSRQHSSPEELLNLTSELLSRWLQVGCSPSIKYCNLPTLPPSLERKDYGPSRARLLTTKMINNEEKGQSEKMVDTTQLPSNNGPPSLSYYNSVLGPLLFRLYWWLLP